MEFVTQIPIKVKLREQKTVIILPFQKCFKTSIPRENVMRVIPEQNVLDPACFFKSISSLLWVSSGFVTDIPRIYIPRRGRHPALHQDPQR